MREVQCDGHIGRSYGGVCVVEGVVDGGQGGGGEEQGGSVLRLERVELELLARSQRVDLRGAQL